MERNYKKEGRDCFKCSFASHFKDYDFFLCTLEEVHVNAIKEGAKKFPTVQTRKKFKVEILQKLPVCIARCIFLPLLLMFAQLLELGKRRELWVLTDGWPGMSLLPLFCNQTLYSFHSILSDMHELILLGFETLNQALSIQVIVPCIE